MHALVPVLLAAAGGGSGGFGGGGGGGGGGGFSGGGGGTGGGSLPWWAVLLIIAVVLGFVSAGAFQTWRMTRRRRERVRRVELAAAEASQDDADFAPAEVRRAAAELFCEIQRRWTDRDAAGLGELVGADLMVEWRRRLEDFERKGWHNVVEVRSGPSVEYVGLVNREGEAEDRVVVRLTATLEDYVRDRDGDVVYKDDEHDTTTALAEYWTLQPPGERWRLLSIEQDREGAHQLDEPIVATPAADPRVRDEAVTELAAADALPAGVAVAEVASPSLREDARAAALDLSLVDGRFATDVLETAARQAVEAWVEAIDGDDAALQSLATPAAVAALLHGGDASGRTRVVVRGARVERLEIAGLDADARPARMTLELQARGRRYVEDRDTTDVLSGSKESERAFSQRWTFELSGDAVHPWRLAGVEE